MDDLMSLDWNSHAPKQQSTAPTNAAPSYPAINLTNPPSSSARSSPLSARSITPVSANALRGPKAPPKTSAPANDSFSSLLGPKQAKTDTLSLQERQRQLQAEKEKQWKHLDSRPGPQDAAFWDSLGSGRSTPNPSPGLQSASAAYFSGATASNSAAVQQASTPQSQDEDDILAAFNSAAPVDASSHYPVPNAPPGSRSRPIHNSPSNGNSNNAAEHNFTFAGNGSDARAEDDDDPFGLGQLASRPKPQMSPQPTFAEQDDDILGDLGKPVSEVRREPVEPARRQDSAKSREKSPASETNPRDRAVAELVDMGFPADKSADALARTEGGTDIQAAVGFLLNQAHEDSKQKSQSRQRERGRESPFATEGERRTREPKRSNRDENAGEAVPAWMRSQGSRSSSQRRQDGRTPTEEKDVAHYAQEFGTTFLKSANSFWKQSQKKVQKALADFDQPTDPTQPKWMRDAATSSNGLAHREPEPSRAQHSATDEAMMLESDRARPQKQPTRSSPSTEFGRASPAPQTRSAGSTRSSTPSNPQHASRPAKLTRESVEQQSAQAYVSPARRKKQQPAPSPQEDLFKTAPSPSPVNPAAISNSQAPSKNPFSPKISPTPSSSSVRAPTPVRPKVPPRQVPTVSPSALSTSASHRQKGTEAFKRGDYAAAHVAYSDALAPLPPNHPIRVVALCNRALTNIKVGDPKGAVADADAALEIIGPSRGESEKIVMGGAEAEKDMKDFFGKALMRKAEGLEHMEKWNEAAGSWKQAVEAGVGGAVSIQGRNRCEKAARKGNGQDGGTTNTPKPSTVARKPPARAPKPAVSTAASAQAVKKLREANQAAEKEDDEKFALSDQVDAKLVAWKGGKADNLRALLGSLDSVLWADAGWKKVGMQDLIMPNKVKIVYMKAIAKVHPDKIPQTATTEQKMISASVFATLNEAWDKFKKDNNL
ncbi:hypothetical protein HDK64DRAFT_273929 [Phyllosticta capitalensis]